MGQAHLLWTFYFKNEQKAGLIFFVIPKGCDEHDYPLPGSLSSPVLGCMAASRGAGGKETTPGPGWGGFPAGRLRGERAPQKILPHPGLLSLQTPQLVLQAAFPRGTLQRAPNWEANNPGWMGWENL